MKELQRRLFHSKTLASEIFLASFFVNLLSLASPIFVIQILSRYIGYGFDGTLYTLTSGMFIALVLGAGFSVIRTRMCAALSVRPDEELQSAVLAALAGIKAEALGRIPLARLQEISLAPQSVQAAFEASRIAAVLDMPFFLLFLFATFLLSPLLALITLLAVICSLIAGGMNMTRARKADAVFRESHVAHRSMVNSAIAGGDTVRMFNAAQYLGRVWKEQIARLLAFRNGIVNQKSYSQAVVQSLGALLRVAVYAVGAKLVVLGDLTVGALIGASILSAKALQIASNYNQAALGMTKAGDTLHMVGEFLALPRESGSGSALKEYDGKLEFKDVAIAFPGASGPLFESLTVTMEPGTIVGIMGKNGTGKTTLAKLAVGLYEPIRGQVLADGVDLRQLATEWWRSQVVYVPQEPAFLNGTYRENITLLNRDVDENRLNEIVRLVDLKGFLDASPTGLDTPVEEGGKALSVGVRKRLALARALVGQAKIAVLDEPTEGLDAEGCAAVYNVMNLFAKQHVTMLVVSSDPQIVKGFNAVVDLNSKPVPRIGVVRKNGNESQAASAGKG